MQSEIDELKFIIDSLNACKSVLSYATNSISLSFLSETGEKLFFFHIDPPWRICRGNSLVQTSYNYPYHDNYSDQEREVEERDFRSWCALTEFMKYEGVKSISVNENYDLSVIWKNDVSLNTFSNDADDPSYFFYDKINNKVYGVGYRSCVKSDLKAKQIVQ